MTKKSIMNILMPKLKGQLAKKIVIIQFAVFNYLRKIYSAHQQNLNFPRIKPGSMYSLSLLSHHSHHSLIATL